MTPRHPGSRIWRAIATWLAAPLGNDVAAALRAVVAQLGRVWFDHRMADALRDEAPAAYKDLGAVMRAQVDLTRIVRRVRPRPSYKGA